LPSISYLLGGYATIDFTGRHHDIGGLVAVLHLSRGDDSWGPIILAGFSFALGAYLLFDAFRR
jgi:hypothetical protein